MATAVMPAYTIGVLAPQLLVALPLGPAVIGLLVAVSYGSAALLSPAVGGVVDRLGERRLMLVQPLLAASALIIVAVAANHAMLLLAMVVSGLGLAIANPAGNRLIHRAAAPSRAGVIVGVKQSGVPLGWLIVGSQLPLLVPVLGWRPATVSLLLFPFIGVLLAWRLPRTPRSSRSVARVPGGLGGLERWLLVYALLLGTGSSGVVAYLPLTAVELSGLSPGAAGFVGGVVGASAVAARLAWGWASRRLERLDLAMVGIAALSIVASGTVLLSSRTAAAVWVAALLFGASAVSVMAVLTVHLLRVSEPAAIGRASGWISLAYFGGFIPGPLLFGALVTWSGAYRLPWIVSAALFTIAALIALRAAMRVTTPHDRSPQDRPRRGGGG